jgi:short-subunit dehydrogenase
MSYQNALITGASSGMGRGIAVAFAKKGVTVYAAARRTAELEKLRDECKDFSGKIIPMALDVSDGDQTFETVKKLDDDCGGLDLVIANAGVAGETYGKRIDWPTIKRMIDVNVTGAAATLTGALSAMVKRGKGQLVGISSLAAFNGLPRMASYCASKAYLATFLEALRLDVKPLGIFVCSIHPGFVKSEMTANHTKKMPFLLETDDAVERMVKSIERRDETFLFPWQMGMGVKLLASLPRPLFEVAARKMR